MEEKQQQEFQRQKAGQLTRGKDTEHLWMSKMGTRLGVVWISGKPTGSRFTDWCRTISLTYFLPWCNTYVKNTFLRVNILLWKGNETQRSFQMFPELPSLHKIALGCSTVLILDSAGAGCNQQPMVSCKSENASSVLINTPLAQWFPWARTRAAGCLKSKEGHTFMVQIREGGGEQSACIFGCIIHMVWHDALRRV